MSFHFGAGPKLSGKEKGIPPRFICDRCQTEKVVPDGGRRGPPMWFIEGNPPPGWVACKDSNGLFKTHLCKGCKPQKAKP